MEKAQYEKRIKKATIGKTRRLLLEQLDLFYSAEEYTLPKHEYREGDYVSLRKGTLLHGTYKNMEGLKSIAKNGLCASMFFNGRKSKYSGSVGVWNLKQDYLLKDYINFYSGGTIRYSGIIEEGEETGKTKTGIIPFDRMNKLLDIANKIECHKWMLEQTKESRFLPSLVQNHVQIGIIFNGNNKYAKALLKKDLLNPKKISDRDAKPFVSDFYYKEFVKDRVNKDDFFTDRESAVLFGIPANLIEGVLVGRLYEKDINILKEIKELLPNAYICNLDGKVIVK